MLKVDEIGKEKLRARLEYLHDKFQLVEYPQEALKRFGSSGDGGYVLAPALIFPNSKVLSFGVGDDISFENSLSDKVEEIHFYDHTVENLPNSLPNSVFFKLGISNEMHKNFKTIDMAISDLNVTSETNILKIDIEGSEWKSIAACNSENLQKFSQIVIECHDLISSLFSNSFESLRISIEKLMSSHVLVYKHANNFRSYKVIANIPIADVYEITLIRKDFCVNFERIPRCKKNPLETKNNHLGEDIVLCSV